jgi:hypothetical protein
MDHFNDNFDKAHKNTWSLAKLFVGGWVVWGLLSLGLSIGLIVVAVHFIAKFW